MNEEDKEMELSEVAKLFGKTSRNKFQKLMNRFIPHMKRNTQRHKENAKLENELSKLKSKEALIKENIALKKKNQELKKEIAKLKKELDRLILIDKGIVKEEAQEQSKQKVEVKEEKIINEQNKEVKAKAVEEITKNVEEKTIETKDEVVNEKKENVINFSEKKDDKEVNKLEDEPKKSTNIELEVENAKTIETMDNPSQVLKEFKITNTLEDLKMFQNLNENFSVGDAIKECGIKAIGEEKVNNVFKRLLDLRAEGYVEFKSGNLFDIKNAEFELTKKGKDLLNELNSKEPSIIKNEVTKDGLTDDKSIMTRLKNEAREKSIKVAKKNLETQKSIQNLKGNNDRPKEIQRFKTEAR